MRLDDLLSKPVSQMTGEEFIFLQNASHPNNNVEKVEDGSKKYVYGIDGLRKIFGCSRSTANRLKKEKFLAPAITQIGRKIIIDADLALELVNAGKEGKCHGRR